MAAYVIANIQITDPDRYPEYASRVPQTIERHGGRYLARGGKVEVLEGEWEPSGWSSSSSRAWSACASGTTRRNTPPSSSCARRSPTRSSSSKAYRLENGPRISTLGDSVNRGNPPQLYSVLR